MDGDEEGLVHASSRATGSAAAGPSADARREPPDADDAVDRAGSGETAASRDGVHANGHHRSLSAAVSRPSVQIEGQ